MEDVLHAGHLRGEEQNLVQGSSRPETTDGPSDYLRAEGEGHDTHTEHLYSPHHSQKQHSKSHKKGGKVTTNSIEIKSFSEPWTVCQLKGEEIKAKTVVICIQVTTPKKLWTYHNKRTIFIMENKASGFTIILIIMTIWILHFYTTLLVVFPLNREERPQGRAC